MQEYEHRKNYVKPLHARLASTAGIPLAMQPGVVAGDPPRPVVCAADLAEGRGAAQAEERQGDRGHGCVHAAA